MIAKYLKPLGLLSGRDFLGRDDEMKLILATLNRKEVSNVALVGDPGTGKTTLVRGVMAQDKHRSYFELKTSLLASSEGGIDGSVEMGTRLTKLINEVELYQQNTQDELVLFIDEFHYIMEVSNAAMEALKPILEESGKRKIRIIIATTFREYDDFVRKNAALNERLIRVTVREFDQATVYKILENAYHNYLPDEIVDPHFIRTLVSVTDRVKPADKQPRKSLRLLDAIIGWHDTFGTPISVQLMNDMVRRTLGITLDQRLDVKQIEQRLNHRVFDQTFAVQSFIDQLYISLAQLNSKSKCLGSFLFTGPTGVGKTKLSEETAAIIYGDSNRMIRCDMSEFSRDENVDAFQKFLTRSVSNQPESLILLDEIEKASQNCNRLLLQVLDKGRLTDENGLEVNFKDTYIILTTNAGAGVFGSLQESHAMSLDRWKSLSAEELRIKQNELLKKYYSLIYKALQSKINGKPIFPAELLGRIDKIVPFSPISELTRQKICRVLLSELKNQVIEQYDVYLHFDSRVEDFIVREGIGSNKTDAGGGREVEKRINTHVVARVAEALLLHPDIRELGVAVSGVMSIEDEFDAKGSARVVVGEYEREAG